MAPVAPVQTDAAPVTPVAQAQTNLYADAPQAANGFLLLCPTADLTMLKTLFHGNNRVGDFGSQFSRGRRCEPLRDHVYKFFIRDGFDPETLSSAVLASVTVKKIRDAEKIRKSTQGKKDIKEAAHIFADVAEQEATQGQGVARTLFTHSDAEVHIAYTFTACKLKPDELKKFVDQHVELGSDVNKTSKDLRDQNVAKLNAAGGELNNDIMTEARAAVSEKVLDVDEALKELAAAAAAAVAAAATTKDAATTVGDAPVAISATVQEIGKLVLSKNPKLFETIDDKLFWKLVVISVGIVFTQTLDNAGQAKTSESYTLKAQQAVAFAVFFCSVVIGTDAGGLALINEGAFLLNLVSKHVTDSKGRFKSIFAELVGQFPDAETDDLNTIALVLCGGLVRLEIETGFTSGRNYGAVAPRFKNSSLSEPRSLRTMSATHGTSAVLLLKSIIACGLFLRAHGQTSLVHVTKDFMTDFGVNFILIETYVCGGQDPRITQFAHSVCKDSGRTVNVTEAAALVPDAKRALTWGIKAGTLDYLDAKSNMSLRALYLAEDTTVAIGSGISDIAARLKLDSKQAASTAATTTPPPPQPSQTQPQAHQEHAGDRRQRDESDEAAPQAKTGNATGEKAKTHWYCPHHRAWMRHKPEDCDRVKTQPKSAGSKPPANTANATRVRVASGNGKRKPLKK